MSNIKTVRRNAWLLSYNDLTPAKQADVLSFIESEEIADEDQSGAYFFFYKGIIYDVREFERTETEGWDGVYGLNAFAAVYVRLSDDGDYVDVGFHCE